MITVLDLLVIINQLPAIVDIKTMNRFDSSWYLLSRKMVQPNDLFTHFPDFLANFSSSSHELVGDHELSSRTQKDNCWLSVVSTSLIIIHHMITIISSSCLRIQIKGLILEIKTLIITFPMCAFRLPFFEVDNEPDLARIYIQNTSRLVTTFKTRSHRSHPLIWYLSRNKY